MGPRTVSNHLSLAITDSSLPPNRMTFPALVNRAVSAVPVGAILDNHDRHRLGGHAGHRADRIEMMIWGKPDGA